MNALPTPLPCARSRSRGRGPWLAVLCLSFGGAAFARGECGECTADGRSSKLCAQHQQLERDELSQFKKLVRSDSAEARVAAYERLAELSSAHENAPSLVVAKLLAKGTGDESGLVRRRVLQFLMRRQHPAVVVPEVIKSSSKLGARWKLADRIFSAFSAQKKGPSSKDLDGQDLQAAYEETLLIRSQVLALGQIRDGHAAELLADLLESRYERWPGRLLREAALSAIQLGSARSIGACIDGLGKIEAGAPFDPLYTYRQDSEWVTVGTALLAELEKIEPASLDDALAISAALFAAVEQKGLEPPPKPQDGYPSAGDWSIWWRDARRSYDDDFDAIERPLNFELPEFSLFQPFGPPR